MSDKLQGLLPQCREMLRVRDDLEGVLLLLRRNGCHKIESIKALIALKRMNLADAKRAVHLSETWADVRRQDEQLEAALVDELISWAEEAGRERS